MKSLKSLAVAGLLAAALGQSAWATSVPHIYLTGSTAFRTAAINAVTSSLGLTGSGSLASGGGTGNDTTNSPNSNTSFIWEGGSISVGGVPTAVTVVATFTGSESGVVTVEGNLAIPFLPDGSTGTANASAYNDAQATTPHSGYPTHIPDFCFSDVYQSTTPFTADAGYIDSTNGGNDFQVAICTFKFMASKNFPIASGSSGTQSIISTLSIDENSALQLWGTGKLPLAMLTGNSGDRTTEIFATGRNPDSGTRATALSDTLFGALKVVKQYQPTISGGVVTSHQLYPVETIAGQSTGFAGNSGEASGGTLRAYMTATLPNSGLTNETAGTTAAYYITYLGTSDAVKVEGTSNGGAVEIAFNGVNFSIPAIYDGHYGFWSYEHVMDRGDLVSPQLDVETSVVNTVEGYATSNSNISGTGISITDPLMQVKRGGDGSQIKPRYNF